MKKLSSFISSLFFLPVVAFAQLEVPAPEETILADGAIGINDLIVSIGNWLFTILLVLAVLFILLAAYRYLTSGGGEGVEKAHKMLIYAAVAIAVAFLSQGVSFVVAQLLRSGGAGT